MRDNIESTIDINLNFTLQGSVRIQKIFEYTIYTFFELTYVHIMNYLSEDI